MEEIRYAINSLAFVIALGNLAVVVAIIAGHWRKP